MNYDRGMGHSLQIYLLCAAIHLMSIISLAFTYSALLNKGVLQINVPGCNLRNYISDFHNLVGCCTKLHVP